MKSSYFLSTALHHSCGIIYIKHIQGGISLDKVKEIMNEIESLHEEERKELLQQLNVKYAKGFPVGENFNFWFDGADDVYDNV